MVTFNRNLNATGWLTNVKKNNEKCYTDLYGFMQNLK